MLAAYARPGAAQAALCLQDEHGQHVTYLLWAAWGRIDDPVLLARGATLARDWDMAALKPLRQVRRALKPAFPGLAGNAREALRQGVKAAELNAEQVLAQGLEATGAKGSVSTLQALVAAAQAWGTPAPEDALRRLAEVLA